MAIVDIFLYEGATPEKDVILSDPTQQRIATVYVPQFAWQSFWKVIDAWQSGPLRPWSGPRLPQTKVDNPPFGYRNPVWLGLPRWQEHQLTPLIVGYGIFVPTDVPWRRTDPSLWTILRSWEPGPPYRIWDVRNVAIFRAPDNPPFGVKTALGPVLVAWQPGPSLPWHGRYVPQEFVETVNDPPFGLKNPLWPIIASWQPGPPLPWRRHEYAVLETVIVPDDPPFGVPSPLLWKLLDSWKPGPPNVHWGLKLPPSLTDVPVNDPPFGLKTLLWTIRSLWEPGPILVPPKFAAGLPLPQVDEPPYGMPSPSLSIILGKWQPEILVPRKGAVSPDIFASAIQRLTALSLELTPGLSQTISWSGSILPIQILAQAPTDPPPGNKGVAFVVTGGALVIYAWDGAVWRALS